MVTVEYKAAKNIPGTQNAFISFPYDIELVKIVRQIDRRYWHPKLKQWEIHINDVEKLFALLKAYKVKEVGKRLQDHNQKQLVFPLPELKTTLLAHQEEGYQYGMNLKKFILGDEAGVGKSIQALSIIKAIQPQYKHALVVCGVNSIKWNWEAEIQKHTDMTHILLGARKTKKGKQASNTTANKIKDLDSDKYVHIVNIEAFRQKEFVKKIKKKCADNEYGIIVLDEAHMCKNPTAAQSKGFLQIFADIQVPMTGTLVISRPFDLYLALKWIGLEKCTFDSFKHYYGVYGGYGGFELVGYQHLDELQKMLSKCYLRRTKAEVLDLPPKIYKTEYVELGTKQREVYNWVEEELLENLDAITMHPNPLTMMLRLRQAATSAEIVTTQSAESSKLDRLEELVDEIVSNGEKIVVFSCWTTVTNLIEKRLAKYNPAVITGEVKDRDVQQNKFMTDDTCKVCIGTIGAMGLGLTLTVATTSIFVDLPYTYAAFQQAVDRIYRIGTTRSVLIITLIAKDTIDELMVQIIERKKVLGEALMDNKHDLSRQDVLKYLVGGRSGCY